VTALPEFNLFGERTPPPPPPKLSYAPVYEAFAEAGGKLDVWGRKALGQQARKLVSDGWPIEQVVRAARQCGSDGNAAVFLGRTMREMPEQCVNGEARARLTQEQLAKCSCAACAKWAQLRAGQPLDL